MSMNRQRACGGQEKGEKGEDRVPFGQAFMASWGKRKGELRGSEHRPHTRGSRCRARWVAAHPGAALQRRRRIAAAQHLVAWQFKRGFVVRCHSFLQLHAQRKKKERRFHKGGSAMRRRDPHDAVGDAPCLLVTRKGKEKGGRTSASPCSQPHRRCVLERNGVVTSQNDDLPGLFFQYQRSRK